MPKKQNIKHRAIITFRGIEFETAAEALQHTEAARGVAIGWKGKFLAVDQETTNRLATAGVPFAYLADHNGQIVTIPIN